MRSRRRLPREVSGRCGKPGRPGKPAPRPRRITVRLGRELAPAEVEGLLRRGWEEAMGWRRRRPDPEAPQPEPEEGRG
jgi:hypothetical protein